jgi:hypothetical protein
LVSGKRKTSTELDKETAKDLVRSFIRVQASDYFRRTMNEVWPEVNDAIDELVANGAKVDLQALIRQVWLDRQIKIGSGE